MGTDVLTITLITICWNSAARIGRCVESVLAQDCLPMEYLFVDGGSTDGTLEYLDGACRRLSRAGVSARVLRQERKTGEAGIPSAWNQGLAVAKGDIIGLLNSDDYYEEGTLKRVVQAFTGETELVCGSVRMVDAGGKELCQLHPRCLVLTEFLMPLCHPGTFVARSLYERIGLYDTRYRISADYDFVWRCRRAHAVLRYEPELLVNMEAGGTANSSRALARNETRAIALRHTYFPPLAWLAWLARYLTGR